MANLNFGHRLGLLKSAWGFTIGDELMVAMAGETANGKHKLNKTTVNRWVSTDKGGESRDHNALDLTMGLASHLESQGYFRTHDTNKEEFLNAFAAETDLEFCNFISSISHEAPQVPQGVLKANHEKLSIQARKIIGYSLVYRLGHDVEKEGGLTISVKPVLRVIPVLIWREGSAFKYTERYFENDAKGFVFLVDRFVTIFAEDGYLEGYSELSMQQFSLEPVKKDSIFSRMFTGSVAMSGDLGTPTAYKILFKQMEVDLTIFCWEDFVKLNEKEIPLAQREGDFDVLETAVITNEERSYYNEIVDFLQISKTAIELTK